MSLAKVAVYCTLLMAFFVSSVPGEASDRCKVGLALSGGGARGGAIIGVLKVLEREGIHIDCIAGTSSGALTGGLYSVGKTAAELEEIFLGQDWGRYFTNVPERQFLPFSERVTSGSQVSLSMDDWTLELPLGLYEGQPLREIINEQTTSEMLDAQYDFDNLPIRFRAVATDLVTLKQVVINKGSMSEAIRASTALPVFFTPVEIDGGILADKDGKILAGKDGKILVDGGLTNNLPVDVVRDQLGAEFVIAVDVSSPPLRKDQLRDFFDVSNQLSNLRMTDMDANRQDADYTIKPDLEGFSTYDFSRVSESIKQGETEAMKIMEELKATLSKKLPEDYPRGFRNETARLELQPSSRPGLTRALQSTLNNAPNEKSPIIGSITFEGLKSVSFRQAMREVRTRKEEPLDLRILIADTKRLYATRLFDSVNYYFDNLSYNRYRLIFAVKEASTLTLDAGIRYDNEFKFVGLARLTSRQMFDSPTTLTVSSQFGGLEDHSATLRYRPSYIPFLFIEPKAYASRREHQFIQNQELIDDYEVRRLGGQILFGGTFFKQIEIAAGYRFEDVHAFGANMDGEFENPYRVGGLTLHINRDTLDDREFPSKGMVLAIRADYNQKRFGGDFDYFKARVDLKNYFSLSDTSTFGTNLLVGFAEYDAPLYEGFYLGGYGFSTKGSYPLPGYDRDEILSEEVGVLGIQYRQRIYNAPLGFIKSAYLTTIFNSYIDGFLSEKGFFGGGIGLAVNTILGPIRMTGGFGDAGRAFFYFTIGPEF